ncbi:MAG: fumarylacetoacetate hydrolase family protein [Bryobacterales bacterium]|nr:fumarylacetoacetate hydrolase family protein [Bryobacterales bacterium]
MKLVRFTLHRDLPATTPDTSALVKYGVVEQGTVYETGPFWSERSGAAWSLAEVRLLPPCWPSKIVCVGRNYEEHAREMGNLAPAEPVIFLKPPSALAAHGDPILMTPLSSRVDYEGEIGVVIGRKARQVPAERAYEYILGYTCVNDVTARDLQMKDGQWARAKGFDTFCPVGPWIAPATEVALATLRLRTWLNGELRQQATPAQMIFDVPRLIAFISEVMTLEPGDLIATGTPAGVGPLTAGAVVRVEIEGVGTLENRAVAP